MKTLYYNGKLITMAKNAPQEQTSAPDALLVEKGKIAAVGRFQDLLAASGKAVKLVDLQGKCLMPGFIDPHGHITTTGLMAMFADLSGCTSFDEIVETLQNFMAKKGIKAGDKKAVVVGFGYDHNFLKEQTQPDRRVLDRVSREIPVVILHVSIHFSCANSAALKLAGITAETPDPEGGKIARLTAEESAVCGYGPAADPDGTAPAAGFGEPSGYLEETASHLMVGALGKALKPDLKALVKGMQRKYLENGVTTAQDGATMERDWKILKILSSLGLLKLDVVAYPLLTANGREILKKNPKYDGNYHKRLKIGGYKMILDGSPQGRSAWMSRPYLGGDPGYCAYPWLPDEKAAELARIAVEDGKQLLAHCNGDAASEQFLNAYENAAADRKDLRPVMIHCQTVRSDQLDRMARLNMIASIFVGHVWYWGDVHRKNFGEERGQRISPAAEALRKGLHVNFHQDPPVTAPNMLHSVWCAVNRIGRSGTVIGEDQKVSVYDALRAVTIEGAYQYFEEDSKGTLEPGKRADLVILDRSPLETDPMEIKDIKVLETVKDGRTVYRAGR
ncbi:MAG: amidohydrolase [Clostridiales bacterium]|nr:amidohydrolase [Clostridiales bacterium]